jgi:two-component system, response regulator PdtaR
VINMRILIVEDESILAMNLQRLLKRLGYDAFKIVSRGEEAVKAAERDRPDLIMMDIHLKGRMNGLQSADCIRRFLDVPILFTTAYCDDETLELARNSSPSALLMKPYEITDLKDAIEAFCTRRRTNEKADRSGDPGFPRGLRCEEPESAVSEADRIPASALTTDVGVTGNLAID